MTEDNLETLQEQYDLVSKELETLRSKVANLTEENEKYSNLEQEYQNFLKLKEENTSKYKKSLEESTKEYDSLVEVLNNATNNNSENIDTNLEQEISRLQSEISIKETKLKQMQENNTKNTKSSPKNQEKYKQIQKELDKYAEFDILYQKHGDLEQYIEDLNQQITKLRTEKADLESSKAAKEKRIATNTKFANHLSEKAHKLSNEFQELINKISSNKKDIEMVDSYIENERKKVSDAEFAVLECQNKNKELTTQLQAQYQQAYTKLELNKSQLQQLTNDYNNMKNQTQQQADDLKKLLKSIEVENKSLTHEVGKMEDSGIATGKSVDEEMQGGIDKIRSRMDDLKARIESTTKDVLSIKSDIQLLDQNLDFQMLKKKPSKKILSNHNFNVLKVLLEETIIQNFKLRCEIAIYMDKLAQAEGFKLEHPELFPKPLPSVEEKKTEQKGNESDEHHAEEDKTENQESTQ